MTYTSGQIANHLDFSGLATQVNDVWGTGIGDSGYGQTSIVTPIPGDIISASEWGRMQDVITKMAAHQGTTLPSTFPTPASVASGATLSANPSTHDFQTAITSITTNRLDTNPSDMASASIGNSTRASVWGAGDSSINTIITCTWATANKARHFFNTGGEIRLDMFQNTNANAQDASWVSFFNSMGILKFGGALTSTTGALGTVYAYTYHDLPTTNTTIYFGDYGTTAYATNDVTIAANLNAGGNILTFTITCRDQHVGSGTLYGSGPDFVSAGAGVDILTYKANGTYLNDAVPVDPTFSILNPF